MSTIYEKYLKDFQRDSVRKIIKDFHGRALLADDMGLGKSLPVDTPVLTPEMFKPIGRLKVGDLVGGSDGRFHVLKGVYPQGIQKCYEITFSPGDKIVASADHLWEIKSLSRGDIFVATTEQIKVLLEKNDDVYEVPIPKEVHFPEKKLKHSSSAFECGKRFQEIMVNPTAEEPSDFLACLSEIIGNSFQIRKQFFLGLTISFPFKSNERGFFCFETFNNYFAYYFKNLIESFGGICQLDEGNNSFYLSFKMPKFLHDVLNISFDKKKNKPYRLILNIESVKDQECVCISIDSPDKLFLIRHYILTHNTIQGLAVSEYFSNKTLIICPNPLKYNWVNEINKFIENANIFVCSGQKVSNIFVPDDADFYIINYEILQYWKDKLDKLKCNFLIVDEGHNIKDRITKKTKNVIKLSRKIPYILVMTGTPIENKPIDLWPQLMAINHKWFPSWLEFAKRYNGAVMGTFGWEMKSPTNVKELHDFLLKNCMIRRKKREVLKELPARNREVIALQIDNRREYNEADNDILNWIKKNKPHLNLDKAAKCTALAKLDNLKLIAAKGKVRQVVEWINQNSPNIKIVVFCYHKEIMQLLQYHIKDSVSIYQEMPVKKRQEVIDDFQNNDKKRVFISTCKIGGTGLTLTASSLLVMMQYPWTASLIDQAESRIDRIGQTAESIDIIHFVGKDTVEEDIAEIIDSKLSASKRIIDGEEAEKTDLIMELLKRNKKRTCKL